MVLTAAIDNGYIFMALIAILTSVISAVYYLVIVKQIFFDKPEESINSELNQLNLSGYIYSNSKSLQKELLTRSLDISELEDSNIKNNKQESISNLKKNLVNFGIDNIVLSSSLTLITSCLTLIIIGFMLNPAQLINISSILAIILFNI